jgi:hypothetical protein
MCSCVHLHVCACVCMCGCMCEHEHVCMSVCPALSVSMLVGKEVIGHVHACLSEWVCAEG